MNKTMARVVIIFFLMGIIMSCSSKQCLSKKQIIGKYVNTSELAAIHYVELYSNGDYYHVYERGEVKLENKGKWITSQKNCEVLFSSWKSYGEFAEESCKNGCSWSVPLKDYILHFSPDLPEMNFSKEIK